MIIFWEHTSCLGFSQEEVEHSWVVLLQSSKIISDEVFFLFRPQLVEIGEVTFARL